jgi:hypothetical protein
MVQKNDRVLTPLNRRKGADENYGEHSDLKKKIM